MRLTDQTESLRYSNQNHGEALAVSFWSVEEMKESEVFQDALAEETALLRIEVENLRACGIKLIELIQDKKNHYDDLYKKYMGFFDALQEISAIPNLDWNKKEQIEKARNIAYNAVIKGEE